MESKVLVEYCSTTANLGGGGTYLQNHRNWIHWYLCLASLKSSGYFKEWLDVLKIMRSAFTNLFPALICDFKELCAPSAKCIYFFVSLIVVFLFFFVFFFFNENIEINAGAERVNSALLALENEMGPKGREICCLLSAFLILHNFLLVTCMQSVVSGEQILKPQSNVRNHTITTLHEKCRIAKSFTEPTIF